MTTGLRQYRRSTPVGPGYIKSWSGTNGKFEPDTPGWIYNGSKDRILKWNAYSLVVIEDNIEGFLSKNGWVTVPSCPYDTVTWSNNDELRLLGRLLQRVRDTDFNAGVFLGEFGKSRDLIVSNLSRLARVAIEVKHGNVSRAARLLGASPKRGFRDAKARHLDSKDISSNWLELQYGWLPLLSDCYEGAQALSVAFGQPRKLTVQASATAYKVKSVFVEHNWMGNSRYAVTKKIRLEMKEKLSTSRVLNINDPLSVAWELIPYSFIADWFIPIGNYLSVLEQIPSLAGRKMRSDAVVVDSSMSGLASLSPEIGESLMGKTTCYHRHQVSRSVPFTTPFEVPMPQFSGLEGVLHGNRVWNAIALFRQQLSSDSHIVGVVKGRRRHAI